MRALIQDGIHDGSIASCNAKIAAFAIAGSLNWMCMWYKSNGELSAQAIARQFAVMLTRGLAPGRTRSAKAAASGSERGAK